jgi:hypothetical protein
MRTQLLGRLALLLGALALLGGAEAARAQGYSPNGFTQGYGGSRGGAPSWYTGYNQAAYNQGYAYNPYYYYYYNYYYPYYANMYRNYYNSAQGAQVPATLTSSAPSATAAAPAPATSDLTLPMVPLGPEGPTSDGAEVKAATEPVHRDCFWFSADYQASWIQPWRITTPLVTTGPQPSATSPPGFHTAGLGQEGTVILLGNSADFGMFNGIRLGAGVWLDEADHCSLEWLGFYNIANNVRFDAASDATGSPIIARPIFDTNLMANRAYLDSTPGFFAGGTSVDMHSQFLGTELNGRIECCLCDRVRIDGLLGFRFLRLTESLTVRDRVTALVDGSGLTFEAVPLPAGDTLTDVDSFRTSNHFYGAQLGTGIHYEGKWFYAGVWGKVALGVTDEEVDINGSTTLFDPVAGVQSAGGGILAQASNIGQHSRTVLAFVPEGGINVGVNVLPCLRLTAGYSFLFWTNVVRPGAQIDRSVNPTMVPSDNTFGTLTGPPRPAFHFSEESFWMHTLNVGLAFRY